MNTAFRQETRAGRLELESGIALALVSFRGIEHLNALFEYELDCVSPDGAVEFDALLGTHASVILKSYDASETPFDGIVTEAMGDAKHPQGQIESFDWPGDHPDPARGKLVASLRMQAERGQDRRYSAEGTIGFTLTALMKDRDTLTSMRPGSFVLNAWTDVAMQSDGAMILRRGDAEIMLKPNGDIATNGKNIAVHGDNIWLN